MNKEEELKTLKDFYLDDEDGISWEELKAEAVKDYKRLLKFYEKGGTLSKEHGKIAEGFEVDIYNYEQDDVSGILKYIKWKFNLTEEDLK